MPAPAPQTLSYLYLAAKPSGGRSVGVRRAKDRRQLAEELRRLRLVPLQTWTLPEWLAPSAGGTLGLKDQAELNFQLGQLLSRGAPLVEALDVVAQSVGSRARPMVQQMRELVAGGKSFSDAAMLVGAGDRVTIAVYRAAERSGDLASAAKQLATAARRQLAVSGKAITLLIYPAFVLALSFIVTIVMLTAIMPRITGALRSAGAQLPWYTSVLSGVGEFLRSHWMECLLTALVGITALVFARAGVGSLIQRGSRRLPLVRQLLLAQESARFFTVMAAMTKNGVQLADSLAVGGEAISHPELREQLSTLRTRLVEGGSFRPLMEKVSQLPVATRRLLIAAERSGDLTEAFDVLSLDATEEVDRRSQRLLAALEPLLIVFIFLVIGSLLMAMLLPLITMSQNLG